MDAELDQVLCTVLSLEEDYPTMSPPPRFQDSFTSTPCLSPHCFLATESPTDLQVSTTLHQKLIEIYRLFEIQQKAQAKKFTIPKEPAYKATIQKPLKRKLEEDKNEGCEEPDVNIDDLQNSNSSKRCRKRTSFNKEQTTFLLNEFDRNPYPDFINRCRIAKITGIAEPRLQVWFQNRRARHPLKHKTSQNVQDIQISTTGDLPNICAKEFQNLQFDGIFQIQENTWML